MDRTEQTRFDGVTQTLWGSATTRRPDPSVFPDRGYEVAFEGGTPQRMTFVLSRGQDRWMRLPLEYSVAPKVTKHGCDLGDPSEWCNGVRGVAEPDAIT